MRQEEGLAPVVCLLSCFLGLHHVIQWGGSDDPKSWTCPEDSWLPSSAQVPELLAPPWSGCCLFLGPNLCPIGVPSQASCRAAAPVAYWGLGRLRGHRVWGWKRACPVLPSPGCGGGW